MVDRISGNNDKYYIRLAPSTIATDGGVSIKEGSLLTLAIKANSIQTSDPKAMKELGDAIFELLVDKRGAKNLDEYLAKTTTLGEEDFVVKGDAPKIDSVIIKFAIFAYGHLKYRIFDEAPKPKSKDAIGAGNIAGQASAYQATISSIEEKEKLKQYHYETLIYKALSLIEADGTNLNDVVQVLVFAIDGKKNSELSRILGSEVYEMLKGYTGGTTDPRAKELLGQVIQLMITAGDNIRMPYTTGYTVINVPTVPLADVNSDSITNIEDVYAGTSDVSGTKPNWEKQSVSSFSPATATEAWASYQKASELLAIISKAGITLNGISVKNFEDELSAKKTAVLQRFIAESDTAASKTGEDAKYNAYAWLQNGSTFFTTVAAKDTNYTPASITAATFNAKMKPIMDTTKGFLTTTKLNSVAAYSAMGIEDITAALEEIRKPGLTPYKKLFNEYYSGNVTDETAAKYAGDLLSQLASAEKALKIAVPAGATILDRWEKILEAQKTIKIGQLENILKEKDRDIAPTDADPAKPGVQPGDYALELSAAKYLQTKINEAGDVYAIDLFGSTLNKTISEYELAEKTYRDLRSKNNPVTDATPQNTKDELTRLYTALEAKAKALKAIVDDIETVYTPGEPIDLPKRTDDVIGSATTGIQKLFTDSVLKEKANRDIIQDIINRAKAARDAAKAAADPLVKAQKYVEAIDLALSVKPKIDELEKAERDKDVEARIARINLDLAAPSGKYYNYLEAAKYLLSQIKETNDDYAIDEFTAQLEALIGNGGSIKGSYITANNAFSAKKDTTTADGLEAEAKKLMDLVDNIESYLAGKPNESGKSDLQRRAEEVVGSATTGIQKMLTDAKLTSPANIKIVQALIDQAKAARDAAKAATDPLIKAQKYVEAIDLALSVKPKIDELKKAEESAALKEKQREYDQSKDRYKEYSDTADYLLTVITDANDEKYAHDKVRDEIEKAKKAYDDAKKAYDDALVDKTKTDTDRLDLLQKLNQAAEDLKKVIDDIEVHGPGADEEDLESRAATLLKDKDKAKDSDYADALDAYEKAQKTTAPLEKAQKYVEAINKAVAARDKGLKDALDFRATPQAKTSFD
jgi:hypothetical protein